MLKEIKEKLLTSGLLITEHDIAIVEGILYVANKPGLAKWVKENCKEYKFVKSNLPVDEDWKGEWRIFS